MRLSLLILISIFISCQVTGQGITKHGLNSSSGSDFVNKNGKTVNIPSLSRYGQELFMVTLTTSSVSSVTSTSAISGGNISNPYNIRVISCGVCWNTSSNPDISDFRTSEDPELLEFTSNLTRLIPSTTYYLRSYVTTVAGTAYGEEMSFRTLPRTDPSECLIAWYPFNGTADEETGMGADGVVNGAVPAEDRFGNPDSAYYFNGTNNSITIPGYLPVNNSFTISFWAFNEKESGTANIISDGSINIGGRDFLLNFRTNEIGIRADKGTPLNYEYSSPAELKNLNLLNRWVHVAWVMNSGSSSIYLDGVKIADITTAGTNEGFHDDHITIGARHVWTNMDNFFQGKLDEFRIYNCNLEPVEILNIYSAERPPELPSVATVSLSDTTSTSISVESNITSDGGTPVTARGVCWSTSPGPTILDNHTSDGYGTGAFTSNVTGLVPGTKYYLRSYSSNGVGIVYGNELIFKTLIIIPTDGLKAHWPFNGNANDETGNGNNGTVYGATLVADRFGNPEKAYYFNGTNNKIYIGSSLIVQGQITISCWIKSSDKGNQIISSGSRNSYRIGTTDDGVDAGVYLTDSSDGYGLLASAAVNCSDWTHVVMTYNGANLSLFVNGQFMDSDIGPGNVFCNQPVYLNFGTYQWLSTCYGYYEGHLDDIYMFNRALPFEEIQSLYHEGGW